MKKLVGFGIGMALAVLMLLGTATLGSASTLPGSLGNAVSDHTNIVSDDSDKVVKVGHRKRERAHSKKFKKRSYRRHHRKFHKRYHPRQRKYRTGHRRFHKHYRKKHRGPKIYFGIYPPYHNPYYYDPYYYDPYYYGPTYRRMSCKKARRLVRRHGYRRVRAYDCKGKVYGFVAWAKGRSYKVKVSAYSGKILSRRRY